MSFTTAAHDILELRRRPSDESAWNKAREAFQDELSSCQEPDEVRKALESDLNNELPVDLKSEAYELLLSLDGRSPETLRRYAWHLQLHGPDWDDLAEAMLSEADEIEHAR
jgi:hypothetical protein